MNKGKKCCLWLYDSSYQWQQHPVIRFDFSRHAVKDAAELERVLENLSVIPLLVQTGYLTIKDYDSETRKYTLAYPNYEVEDVFSAQLFDSKKREVAHEQSKSP